MGESKSNNKSACWNSWQGFWRKCRKVIRGLRFSKRWYLTLKEHTKYWLKSSQQRERKSLYRKYIHLLLENKEHQRHPSHQLLRMFLKHQEELNQRKVCGLLNIFHKMKNNNQCSLCKPKEQERNLLKWNYLKTLHNYYKSTLKKRLENYSTNIGDIGLN